MVGISTDTPETLRRFKESTGAQFRLLSDPGGAVSRRYAGLVPVPAVDLAKRANFVVGEDGIVKEVVAGMGAVDPSSAIAACPIGGSAP